jgi:hypothetical protein
MTAKRNIRIDTSVNVLLPLFVFISQAKPYDFRRLTGPLVASYLLCTSMNAARLIII